MIIQACLNGARPAGYHPALPLTPDAIAHDAAACVAAGAAELHIHPRGADGRESLAPDVIEIEALSVAAGIRAVAGARRSAAAAVAARLRRDGVAFC